jgi:hypothetical protein
VLWQNKFLNFWSGGGAMSDTMLLFCWTRDDYQWPFLIDHHGFPICRPIFVLQWRQLAAFLAFCFKFA